MLIRFSMDKQKVKERELAGVRRFDLDEQVKLKFLHHINQFEIDDHVEQNVLPVQQKPSDW